MRTPEEAQRQFEIDAKPEYDAVVTAAMNWHSGQDIQMNSPRRLRELESELYDATRALSQKQSLAGMMFMIEAERAEKEK